MTARRDRQQDRRDRRRQIQSRLGEWDRDRSDRNRLLVGALVIGAILVVGLIRWLWL